MNHRPSLLHELQRRKVLRVLGAYLAGSWFLLKTSEVVFPTLALPDWSFRALVLVLVLGLPLAAVFAWLFEITPDGVKLQSAVDREGMPTRSGRALTWFMVAAIVVAAGISVYTYSGHGRPPRGTTGAEDVVDPRSIAVLPFANMSPDAGNEYLADGLSEELLNLLARVGELKVVGRTSSFSFKGKQEDLREIGRQLNVASVLEGSVRRSGENVRITAQLVSAEDGFHLWSETYDRTMGDILALQDEIATRVVDALKVELLDHEGGERDVGAETDPAAYDEYLQGRYHYRQRGPADLEAAARSYERALAIDPLFASAHAGLASAHNARAIRGYVPAEEGFAQAELEARRALALRPDLTEPHYQLGMIRMLRDWDWPGAEDSFRRALDVDPADLAATSGFSHVAMVRGRREESVALASRVAAADPLALAANYNLGLRQYQAGHLEDARGTLEKTLEFNPEAPMVRSLLAKVLVQIGHPEDALGVVLDEPAEWWRRATLPIVYDALGRRDDAESALKEVIESHAETASFQIAEVYAVMGRVDEAFGWLETAYEMHDSAIVDLISHPTLASLHGDPRFSALRERLGLSEPQAGE